MAKSTRMKLARSTFCLILLAVVCLTVIVLDVAELRVCQAAMPFSAPVKRQSDIAGSPTGAPCVNNYAAHSAADQLRRPLTLPEQRRKTLRTCIDKSKEQVLVEATWFIECILGNSGEKALHFIQMGANDGVSFDLLHPFVNKTKTRFEWHGALVEPVPWIFDELKHNYRDMEHFQFFNAAVDSYCKHPTVLFHAPRVSKIANIYKNKDSPFFWQVGIGQLHLEGPWLERREEFIELDVKCITLPHIIEQIRYPKLDLLLTDVEGMDWPIVSQWRDNFTEYIRPRMVISELLDDSAVAKAMDFFSRNHYMLFAAGQDYVALDIKPLL